MVYPVWFSEQFSTSVLILPFMLTWNGKFIVKRADFLRIAPLILLISFAACILPQRRNWQPGDDSAGAGLVCN